MVGKAPTATGLAIYRDLAQSANSKKDCAGKMFGRRGEDANWTFVGLSSLRKKKKTDSAGSRSSFKEKGDKSCFTVFVIKQQACQCFYCECNLLFCRNHGLLWGRATGIKRQVRYKKLNGDGGVEVAVWYFLLLFQLVVWVQVFLYQRKKGGVGVGSENSLRGVKLAGILLQWVQKIIPVRKKMSSGGRVIAPTLFIGELGENHQAPLGG